MEKLDQAIQQLIALEAQIDKIGGLQTKVESEGMSRKIAMEAREMIPGFDGNRPLAFYSVEPGYANQVAALESMSDSVVQLIIAAIAALVVVIAACVQHFFGKKKDPFGSGDNSGSYFTFTYTYKGRTYNSYEDASRARQADMDEFAKKAAEEQRQAWQASREASKKNEPHTRRLEEPKVDVDDLDKLFEKAVNEQGKDSAIGRMLYVEDPFTIDLITRGHYTKQMIVNSDSGPGLKKNLVEVESMISILTRDFPFVMDKDKIEGDAYGEVETRLGKMHDTLTSMLQIGWGNASSFKVMAEHVATAKEKMGEGSPPRLFKYSELIKRIGHGVGGLPLPEMKRIFDESSADLPNVQAKLEKLSQSMETFKRSNREDLTANQKLYQHRAHEVLGMLRQHVVAIAKFLQEYDRFGRSLRALQARAFKLQVEGLRLITRELKHAGPMSAELKKLEKEMNEALTIDM